MREIISKKQQTLFDVALQHCGDASQAATIAILNNISLTQTLNGETLFVPNISNAEIVEHYTNNNEQILTA